jgi:hypothetical protein
VVKRSRSSAAAFREARTDEAWLPAQVPGSVHTDLQAKLSVRSLAETFWCR